MKSSLFLILGLCVGLYFAHNHSQKSNPVLPMGIQQASSLDNVPSVSVIFYQDVSGSTKQNGVELISSSIFTPYFNDVNRNIELHFGIIDSLTAEKLVSLALPARKFKIPVLQDLRQLSITEKRQEKERFLNSEKRYESDSIKFYEERNKRISEFCNKVDFELAIYKNNLSGQTDLVTAIDIADKVFSYSIFGNTKNYLLLNSDGQDSFNRKTTKLDSDTEVLLINAAQKCKTSIDDIVNIRLQSSEQAIHFTLNNKKNL
jgi:hypothetical protein